VRERVHGWRLRLAGHDDRPAAVRREVRRNRVDIGVGARGRRTRHREAKLRGHRAGEGANLAGLQRHDVIRTAASHRRRRLDDVEAIEVVGILVDATARGELTRGTQVRRAFGAEEVGVERQNDVSLLVVDDRLEVLAERQLRTGAGVVARDRIPLDPFRRGMLRENLLNLPRERR
jgi:hypothetical protein